jgi:4a-hydroxytetrahydrobiopterin dehydratase
MNKWKNINKEDAESLFCEFTFSNFLEALSFTNKVGELAENANHHPDIELGWGYVKVWLTTHSDGGVTEKDHELATQIDQLTDS